MLKKEYIDLKSTSLVKHMYQKVKVSLKDWKPWNTILRTQKSLGKKNARFHMTGCFHFVNQKFNLCSNSGEQMQNAMLKDTN